MSAVLQRRRRHRYEAVLELTPLIDVIFLLLIFFMVSTSFVVTREIPIQLPQSDSAANGSNPQVLIIAINSQGDYYVNGSLLTDNSTSAIAAALVAQAAGSDAPRWPVRIDGHEAADYQYIVRAMDACRQAGFSDVRLSTVKVVD